MSYMNVASGAVVAELPGEAKAGFIRRTYGHLAMAIAAFALLEAQLLKMGFGEQMMAMLATSKWSWLLVLGAFMLVGVVADKWARNGSSREMQYAGLGLFIVAEAIVFLPLIYIAMSFAPDVLPNAALITGSLVAGLTLVVFTTRKDFSFLAPALAIGGVVAMGLIIASIAFGLGLGMFFSAAMIVFAGISVLYTTSNILHVYREDQHVAASLALFASVALMFWYVVQFLMSFGQE
ncbi:MAG: Bax inhibitor-1 family protein [Arenicella sp.]|nr:Bax inhibitor-1 family protein [Arenicella sp.]